MKQSQVDGAGLDFISSTPHTALHPSDMGFSLVRLSVDKVCRQQFEIAESAENSRE